MAVRRLMLMHHHRGVLLIHAVSSVLTLVEELDAERIPGVW
jgi:hypothetical protein